jgi:hypothetical protein
MKNSWCTYVYMIAIVVSVSIHAKSQIPNGEYLSSNDKGYLEIEKLQQIRCQGPCLTAVEDCHSKIEHLWKLMYRESVPSHLLDSLCARVSTRYETPGVFWMLRNYLTHVQRAASETYRSDIIDAKIGSLSLFDANAGAKTEDKQPLIFINLGYFIFANEIGKVTARTIHVDSSKQFYVIDSSEERFYQTINDNPELLADFAKTIIGFIEGHARRQIIPDDFIKPILVTYDQGMELFAIGHEYAHLLRGHSGKSKSALRFDNDELVPVLKTKMTENSWAQEFEADYISSVLFKRICSDIQSDSSQNIFIVALNASPEFYFLSRSILDNARSWQKTGKTLPPPKKAEVSLLKKFKELYRQPNFDISKFLSDNKSYTKKLKGHPHALIRREVVNLMIQPASNTMIVNQNESLVISELLARNSQLLGRLMQPVFEEYFSGKKKE